MSASASADKLKQNILKPYRIIASEGADEPHWLLNEDNDAQSSYNKLWNEAKAYLEEVMSTKQTPKIHPREKWDEIVVKRAFIFEFKTNMGSDLIKYFLGIQDASFEGPSGVYKLAIYPWEDINYSSSAVYILDGDSKVYEYILNSKKLSREDYEDVLAALAEDESVRGYGVVKEVNLNRNKIKYDISQDILVVKEGNRLGSIQGVNCSIPEIFLSKTKQNASETDFERKAAIILGGDKDSYDPSIDIYDTVVFKNLNNIYKLYKDGLLEYRYIGGYQDGDKGSQKDAFERALRFVVEIINRSGLLSPETDIYISGFEEKGSSYIFTFDYRIKDTPVFFDYKLRDRTIQDKRVINSAITVEANSKKVLNLLWMLRSFETLREVKNYNIMFVDLLDKAFDQYPELKSTEGLVIKDIEVAYHVKASENSQKLEPSWVITTNDGKYYPVEMKPAPAQSKKGGG